MCGEKMTPAFPFVIIWGSPPRVRGKASGSWKCFCAMGITPACAGKSNVRFAVDGFSEDHPRVCGEKFEVCNVLLIGGGITPACAGKSPSAYRISGNSRDHPRVCGEKRILHIPVFYLLGSPPRVRGKDVARLMMFVILGITPACAGKRFLNSEATKMKWDHPRVCGEKTKKIP